MSGIAGWYSPGREIEQPGEILNAMLGRLPPLGEARLPVTLSSRSLAGKAQQTLSCGSERDALAIVEGAPRWVDGRFARMAADQGDAIALCHAWRELGTSMFDLLRGNYALALIDTTDHTVILAVDRMGVGQLCYAADADGNVVFGSTATAVACHPHVDAARSSQALFDYVYTHTVPSPGTIFQNVTKLPPAHVAIIGPSGRRLEAYWTPRFVDGAGGARMETLQAELLDTIRSAVGRCDIEAATFLSGGLDSSTVLGMHAERRNGSTSAYAMGFAADGYDEMAYARLAARHFGCRLIEYYVEPDEVAAAIPEVAAAYDEPFGNSSAVPALLCARAAADNGVPTLLAGDGGDELFAGNERYAKQKLFQLYESVPAFLRTGIVEPALINRYATRLPLVRKLASYVDQARIRLPGRMESYNFVRRETPEAIFDPGFLDSIDVNGPLRGLEKTWAMSEATSIVDRMLYLDWKTTLADNDLRKVTRTCELAGVRVQFPLIDDDLVEFSTRVPAAWKLRRLRLRHFFKESLSGFLPADVIRKKKHGFGLPFGEWLKTSKILQELVYDSLGALKTHRVIDTGYIDRLIELHRSDHAAYYGTMVWVLAMLQQWFETHRDL